MFIELRSQAEIIVEILTHILVEYGIPFGYFLGMNADEINDLVFGFEEYLDFSN